jgi:cystathionine beta-synthase
VGVDPAGSLFYDYFHSKTIVKCQQYLIEGIGEDILPSTLDFSVLDEVLRVQDGESFRFTRRLAREEGILSGGSAGAALHGAFQYGQRLGPDDAMVVLIPERGERTLGKIYNDEWMRRNQFLDEGGNRNARSLLAHKRSNFHDLVTLEPGATVREAIRIMQELEISQIPVVRDGQVVGTIREDQIIDLLLHAGDRKDGPVEAVMDDALPEVDGDATVEQLQEIFSNGGSAVIVRLTGGRREILTKYDLIHGLAHA